MNKDKNEHNLIVLTGSIDPSYFEVGTSGKRRVNVVLRNAEIRLGQYEETIKRFIVETPFDRIVFVENTEYPFDSSKFKNLASEYGKLFEYIRLTMDDDQRKNLLEKGKSYGECLLIDAAVKHSALLKDEDMFYKITGRVFLKNCKAILKSKRKCRNEFVHRNRARWCNTNFFKVSKVDYGKFFFGVENDVDDCCVGKAIEHIYYKIIGNNNIETSMFQVYPDLIGTRGGNGKKYDKSKLELFAHNILTKIGYYNMHEWHR